MKSSTNRFGARYGAKLRKKLFEVEKQQKKTYKCPYCNYEKVKREAAGIWHCSKCDAKFTGKSYSIGKVELK
ncbi:MAG: 50S ribosomal protein L37ae [Nanoarchaeota archaeon]|nr:50S ribosomal protein L37ae [Nanoarchaeota archaeon]